MSDSPSRRNADEKGGPAPAPIRALVVDDDDNYRAFLGALLRRQGCIVRMAADGEDARAQLAAGEFDLLLCDLDMPRMDGLELIAAVRAHPSAATIYAVMLTSYGELSTKLEALASGYDDFLPKSCEEVEVVARLAAARRILTRQRALGREANEWYALASTDALTNVATRRAFFDSARQRIEEGQVVGVALFDLDDFKQINDRHGHLAGDTMLRDLGSLFLGITRHDDLIARYGGDEFVLLMTGLSLDQAIAVAARVESEIRQLAWTFDGKTVRMSASAGVAHSSLLAEPTVELLLEAADRDLYAKKWMRRHPSPASDEVYQYPPREAKVVELHPSAAPMNDLEQLLAGLRRQRADFQAELDDTTARRGETSVLMERIAELQRRIERIATRSAAVSGAAAASAAEGNDGGRRPT